MADLAVVVVDNTGPAHDAQAVVLVAACKEDGAVKEDSTHFLVDLLFLAVEAAAAVEEGAVDVDVVVVVLAIPHK